VSGLAAVLAGGGCVVMGTLAAAISTRLGRHRALAARLREIASRPPGASDSHMRADLLRLADEVSRW